MKKNFKLILLITLLLSSAAYAAKPIEEVLVPSKVTYVAGAGAAEAMVDANCDWGGQIAKDLVKETKNKAKITDQDLNLFNGRKLVLFVNNSADGSEATKKNVKWLSVSGKLYNLNSLIGDFSFQESIYSGSLKDCKNVKYMSSGMASSIASWLENPSRMTLISPIVIAKPGAIDEAAAAECKWEVQIPKNMVEIGDGSVGYLTSEVVSENQRVLKLILTDSRILGGGMYTGAKYMELSGELFENNVKISDFVANRWTTRAWTGCGSIERVTYALAEDITKWLKDPKPGARLGDL